MCIHTQKLEALRHYMNLWIDRYPRNVTMSFESYCAQYYPQMVEGTPEYFRRIATNCYYCNKEMRPGTATIDHFIPKSKGGGDNLYYNRYVICCKECNQAKAAMRPEMFLKQLRRVLIFGGTIGYIERKRLQRVFDNLSQVINEVGLKIQNPIYYRVCGTKRKPPLFFKSKQAA